MASTQRWTAADVPGLADGIAVVTGANSGLGSETAKVLAEHGAFVVLARRDLGSAEDAAARVRAGAPRANVATLRLDLASLAAIREAATRARSSYDHLDLLIDNAGVMATPHQKTEDGFELQFGINHLGHFAFTGLVLGRLLTAPHSRVVTVSSHGHRNGRLNFDDLQSARRYRRLGAYAQSKLANLPFTYELQHRLAAAGVQTIALAAHPGRAQTELERHQPRWMRAVARVVPRQDAATGALPILRAAVDPAARGGDYFGPDGRREFTGYPVLVGSSRRSHDVAAQHRLWAESEQRTGVTYRFAARTSEIG